MKTTHLLLTALLALGISSAACAQTTIPGTTGVPGVPGSPASTSSTVPGQPAPSIGTVPSSTLPTTPAGSIYTPGTTAPTGTPRVLQSTQPAGMAPRNAPIRGTRRANSTNTPPRP